MTDDYPGSSPVQKDATGNSDYPGASPVDKDDSSKEPVLGQVSGEAYAPGEITQYTRGGLPFHTKTPLVTPQSALDSLMMLPAAGIEGGLLKGGTALENVATRAYPKVAQFFAEHPFIASAPKIATAGAGGGATYNAGTGRNIKEGAAIGAGGALTGEAVATGIGAAKAYLNKPLPKATVDLQKSAKAAGLDITGKTPEEINTQVQDWFKGKAESLANNVSAGTAQSEIWPLGKSFSISKNYDKADAAVSKSYDAARAIGKDQHVEAQPVVDGLKQVIDDMEKKSAENIHDPQYASTLAKFKRLYQEIGEGKPSSAILDAEGNPLKSAIPNTVTANKLVEIKQELNKRYVSAPERTSNDTPYSKLAGVIDKAVKNTSPQFQQAISKANKEWTEFSNVYRDNDVLKQFWTPEDHDAFKALTERGIKIPPETQKRVYKMLDKIKTPADLEALKLAMKDYPKEYDSIRAAKFYEIMDKAGLDAKAINKNYDVIIKSLEGDPKAIQMIDAVKTLTEQLNMRGIGNLSPAALAQSDSLIARNFRTIMTLLKGSPITYAKKITELMKEEPASVTQQRLKNVKSEINKKAPSAQPAQKSSGIKAPLIGTGIGEGAENIGSNNQQ